MDTLFDSLQSTYDYIVVGAGPAGCVLASRLSERSNSSVLLIEAGRDLVPGEEHSDVLDSFPASSSNPLFHWPNLSARLSDHGNPVRKEVHYIKGHCVGGGSNVNGMGADRGLPSDYDLWADLGATGWRWKDVLPYFEKLECDLGYLDDDDMDLLSGGLMPVRRLPRSAWSPFSAEIANALERRGYPFLPDYMSNFNEGFSSVPTNSLRRGRVSASMVYLNKKVRRRRNLNILPNSHVERVLMDQRKATGVIFSIDGDVYTARARQIVLCCGAIHTPTLLLKSGIGPGHHLKELGLDVNIHLPGVGSNLQNHPYVMFASYLSKGSYQAENNPWFLQNWMRFSSQDDPTQGPDLHLMPMNKTAWHALGKRVGAIAVTLLGSQSKGSVRLRPAKTGHLPEVQFGMFSDQRDLVNLAHGVKVALNALCDPEVAVTYRDLFVPDGRIVGNLARRSGWNRVKSEMMGWALDFDLLRRTLMSGSIVQPRALLEEEDTLCSFVREHASVQLHDTGTCRIGLPTDPQAVVDSAGRVHGIGGLTVVDASIFPTIPRGYPHFIVMMAAEKIADSFVSNRVASG